MKPALEPSEQPLQAAVQAIPCGLIVYDARRRVRFANPCALAHCARSAADLIGKRDDEVFSPEYCSGYLPQLSRAMETCRTVAFDWTQPEACGGRTLSVTYTPCTDRGVLKEVVALSYDVSSYQQAQEALHEQVARLREQARELARSNTELEQFASLISHDLRSPLVSISGCVELLAEECAPHLTDESHQLLEYIRTSVARMAELIRSVLEYSQAGSRPIASAPCDCERVLDAALSNLRTQIISNRARVSRDPLPSVLGERALLVQLFQNLIENALKYRSDQPPCVHVSATASGNDWTFSVRDNGVGIDRTQIAGLFQLFHRGAGYERECAGLGIGLASCKRIVERHRGRIWVDSTPGAGSTFFFTLCSASGSPG